MPHWEFRYLQGYMGTVQKHRNSRKIDVIQIPSRIYGDQALDRIQCPSCQIQIPSRIYGDVLEPVPIVPVTYHLDTFKDIWGHGLAQRCGRVYELFRYLQGYMGTASLPVSLGAFAYLDTFKDIWGPKFFCDYHYSYYPFRYLQGYMGTVNQGRDALGSAEIQIPSRIYGDSIRQTKPRQRATNLDTFKDIWGLISLIHPRLVAKQIQIPSRIYGDFLLPSSGIHLPLFRYLQGYMGTQVFGMTLSDLKTYLDTFKDIWGPVYGISMRSNPQ